MTKRALLVCLVSGVLAASGGCCASNALLCCLFGQPVPICDPTNCGAPACGPESVPACGDVCTVPETAASGSACDSCGEMCAGACGVPCDPCGRPWGPLSWLFGILTCGFCGNGCGELYWSDFHSEPPDCCDPCDRLGNFTGAASGQEYCASGQCWSGYLSSKCSPSTDRLTGRSPTGSPAGYLTGDAPSRYRPRVISVIDRAVSPAPAEPAPVQQAATPRRAPARQ